MAATKKKRKAKKWVWVVGWILCFPIPLTVILSRSKKINIFFKGILISLLWFFTFIWTLFLIGASDSEEIENGQVAISTDAQEVTVLEEIDYKEKFKSEIGDTGIVEADPLYDDVTGRWRVCVIYTNQDIIPYLSDYYHGFFESDDEIHAIVNLYLKTTTSVTVSGVNLNVVVYEYVDGEEQSAKKLFSGSSYCGYIINRITGEYERYETNWDYTVVESDDSIEEAADNILSNRGYVDYTVKMDGKTLVVEFQMLPAGAASLTPETIAYLTTVSFTDDFLEQYTKDDEWDMIIVKFEGVGEYRLTKDLIIDSGGYGRFFNFFDEDIISY